jgi:hypothetical protein
MFGRSYVKDFCIASFKREQEELAYKIYMSDALKLIAENTAKFGQGGSYIKARYYDIINPKPVDNRTEEEVIDHIKNKLNQL